MRMPLFVWSIYLYAWLHGIVILPVLAAGLTLLLLDEAASRFGPWDVQTHFFNPEEGGSPVLYQHAFWFFGHPEVYMMVLPAFGIISEVLPSSHASPCSATRPSPSTVAIGFFSMLVWAHHLFTVGLPISQAFFMIVDDRRPDWMKIFNWLATFWRGNLHFDTPMLYALGFLDLRHRRAGRGSTSQFPIDGAGARQLRRRPLPLHALRRSDVRDLRGLFYWWPKRCSDGSSTTALKRQFWTLFIGFNSRSSQHSGSRGCRDVCTRTRTSWEGYNLASTIGSYVMGIAIIFFIVNVCGLPGADRGWATIPGRRTRSRVCDLAAATPQLRRRPLRHERETALRSQAEVA